MADNNTRNAAQHGLADPVPNPAGDETIDPTLGSGAPDMVVLQDNGEESEGDAGSDESPRSNPANTAFGSALNSGPTEPDFTGSEEYQSRAQAVAEPGQDAESGVPAKDAEATAPGDNLS